MGTPRTDALKMGLCIKALPISSTDASSQSEFMLASMKELFEHLETLETELTEMKAENEGLKHGEYICCGCGLRGKIVL